MKTEKAPVSLLSKIHKTKHKTPPRIVIHGPEKIGKSTFASTMPNPIFIQCEDGLTGIDTNAFPLCENYDDIIAQLDELCAADHDFKTVVIDSATAAERLIHDRIKSIHNVQTIDAAAGGYGKGYMEAANLWRQVVKRIDYLNSVKGMLVLVIAHSRIVSINDPLGEVYDSFKLRLHSPKSGNGSSELLTEWSDMILFCDQERFQTNKDIDQNTKIRRATTTGNRILYTSPSPAYTAGSRYPLPTKLEMTWTALSAALTNPAQ